MIRLFFSPRLITSLVQLWLHQAEKEAYRLDNEIRTNKFTEGIRCICRLRKCTEAEAQALVSFLKLPPMHIAEFISINNRLPEVAEISFLRGAGMDMYTSLYDRGIELAKRNLFNNCTHDECVLKHNYKL